MTSLTLIKVKIQLENIHMSPKRTHNGITRGQQLMDVVWMLNIEGIGQRGRYMAGSNLS